MHGLCFQKIEGHLIESNERIKNSILRILAKIQKYERFNLRNKALINGFLFTFREELLFTT